MSCETFLILTWHAANIVNNAYSGNDLVAFSEDLVVLDKKGWIILPLSDAIDRWRRDDLPPKTVVLTVDDGPVLDFRDFEHPTCGLQVSIFKRLIEFSKRPALNSRHRLHVSSFVIASAEARRELERVAFMDLKILPDDWWQKANQSGLMSIESHSWDHNHDLLERTAQRNNDRGDFSFIETADECEAEVGWASDFIQHRSGRRPRFFAYPYGQSSHYLRLEYLPREGKRLGLVGALGCDPEPVSPSSDPWFLPRFVCGRDWRSGDELSSVLDAACC
jgi:peptidoglycan/xylan/chitin deacetylase (PgdA/CDA1 family)